MPHPNAINLKTGKRYGWEAAQVDTLEQDIRAAQAEVHAVARQQLMLDARDHLLPFVKFTMPDPEDPNDLSRSRYHAAPFHAAVARALEDVETGETPQLIFCMPPRHGKTELATKRLAAWYSGRHPEHNVAVASYSDTVAEDFGADTRAIMATKQFKQVFPAHKLRRGGTSKTNIQTEQGGRLVFVGRGGALTGRGAHMLLIDDLYKDHEDARSKAIRDQAWNWFTKVAMTRRMGRKLVVITMTRWHSDDIIGRLTDKENPSYPGDIEARRWKIIRLPAIAEDDDPAGRAPGEALWPDGPDRFDLPFLQSQQRLDPLGFEALYQQRPTAADGVLFRRETIQRYKPEELPEDLRYYAASDHAVSIGQRNDPTVLLKIGIDKQDNIYVIDCFWRRVPTDAAVEAMLALGSGEKKPILWWAEKGHISQSIGPFLRKRMLETGIYFNIREVAPVADKQTRAQSIAARVAMGKVFIPTHAPWAEKAIDEMLSFPNGTHDDFVDALAYIGLGLQSQFGASMPKQDKPKEPVFGTLSWLKWNDSWRADQVAAANRGGF
jgi:predicted phage terminase large subunit-like protein